MLCRALLRVAIPMALVAGAAVWLEHGAGAPSPPGGGRPDPAQAAWPSAGTSAAPGAPGAPGTAGATPPAPAAGPPTVEAAPGPELWHRLNDGVRQLAAGQYRLLRELSEALRRMLGQLMGQGRVAVPAAR